MVTRKEMKEIFEEAGISPEFSFPTRTDAVEPHRFLDVAQQFALKQAGAKHGIELRSVKNQSNVFAIYPLPEFAGIEAMWKAVAQVAQAAQQSELSVEYIQNHAWAGEGVGDEGYQADGWFIPTDSTLMYAQPIEPQVGNHIDFEQMRYIVRDPYLRIFVKDYQVVAVHQRDNLVLVDGGLKGLQILSLSPDAEISVYQFYEPSQFSCRLDKNWNDNWVITVEVPVLNQSHSKIRVYMSEGEGAEIGWYATNAGIEHARNFHQAYTQALQLAAVLERSFGGNHG